LLDHDKEQLNRAILYYGKCFKIRSDYYTGENYALCLEFMSQIESQSDEKIYYKIEAKKTREKIIELLSNLLLDENLEQRFDKKWIYATLSHCYLATGKVEESVLFENKFLKEAPVDWERQTFSESKNQLIKLKK
jgi:hypothetical protein